MYIFVRKSFKYIIATTITDMNRVIGKPPPDGNPRRLPDVESEGPMGKIDAAALKKRMGVDVNDPKILFACLDRAAESGAETLSRELRRILLENYRQGLGSSNGHVFCEISTQVESEVSQIRMLLVRSWREGKEASPSHADAIKRGNTLADKADPKTLFDLLNVLTYDPVSHVDTWECRQLAERCETRLLEAYRKKIDR